MLLGILLGTALQSGFEFGGAQLLVPVGSVQFTDAETAPSIVDTVISGGQLKLISGSSTATKGAT